jgi:hypothetical protein
MVQNGSLENFRSTHFNQRKERSKSISVHVENFFANFSAGHKLLILSMCVASNLCGFETYHLGNQA